MDYLQSYVYYNSGSECPRSYHVWSALCILGSLLGRKVWFDRNIHIVYPNIYVGLVGDAGSGKSTAKGVIKTIMVQEFPHLMISDSIQSREDIAEKMGTSECCQTWKDEKGKIHEYRPYFLIVNELANFLSVDTRKMIDFLVDMYDENYFSTGFKTATSQKFKNPYVSMLACVQPTWIMSNLKLDLFSGGLGRRFILVYEEKTKLVAEPFIPAGGDTAIQKVLTHLHRAEKIQGAFTMPEPARKWWIKWYEDPTRKENDDPIIRQFNETEHVMLLKVAMLLACSRDDFKLEFTVPDLEMAQAMLADLKPKIRRLTAGIGENALAAVAVRIMEFVRISGSMGEVEFNKLFYRHAKGGTRDLNDVLSHLQTTGQLLVAAHPMTNARTMFVPARYEQYKKEHEDAKRNAIK